MKVKKNIKRNIKSNIIKREKRQNMMIVQILILYQINLPKNPKEKIVFLIKAKVLFHRQALLQ